MLCLLLESRIRRRRGTVVSAEGIDNRAPMSCTCSYMWSTMAPERVEYVWPYGTHTEREKPRETHSSPPPLPFTLIVLLLALGCSPARPGERRGRGGEASDVRD